MELNSEDQLKIVDSRIKACETDLKGKVEKVFKMDLRNEKQRKEDKNG